VRQTVTVAEGQVLDVGDLVLSPLRPPPGSVGAMVRQEGAQLVIDRVIAESPAESAGLLAGDVLLTVDGAPVVSPGEAFQRLRGAPGSTVVLTVRRAGSERSISITRAP
jgi:carboxyl-terminal processing protease